MTLDVQGMNYSIRIAELVRYMHENEPLFPLCDRLLACGIQAGLASREWKQNHNKKNAEHISDYTVEADYIIEMAITAGYITQQQGVHIRSDGQTLIETAMFAAANGSQA